MLGCMASGIAVAQEGWYAGMELGLAFAPDTAITGGDNDWSTKCDRIINPDELETAPGECASAPARSSYSLDFDGGRGLMASMVLGYRMERLVFEGEYLFRSTVFEANAPIRIGDAVTLGKAEQEIESATGTLDDLLSHGVFANVYYRFSDEGLQPYLGGGLGASRVSLDHRTVWKRNDDPAAIATFEDPHLKAKLAGTTTIGDARHSDTLFGLQLLAGLDYQLGETTTVGVKFRWAIFSEFESDDIPWQQLRGHESSVGRGDDVLYREATDDVSFWALSVGFKHGFY